MLQTLLVLAMLFFGAGFLGIWAEDGPVLAKIGGTGILVMIELVFGYLLFLSVTGGSRPGKGTPGQSLSQGQIWSFTGTSLVLSGAFLFLGGALWVEIDPHAFAFAIGGFVPAASLYIASLFLVVAALILVIPGVSFPRSIAYLALIYVLPILSVLAFFVLAATWVLQP